MNHLVRSRWYLSTALLLILSLAFYSAFSAIGYADDLQQKKEQLQNVQKSIEEKKKQLNNIQREKADLQNQLAIIQQNLVQSQEQLNKAQKQLSKLEESIKIKSEELSAAQKRLNDENDIFKKRVVAMYKSGPLGYLGVLLDSNNFLDFLSRYEIMKRLIKYDKDLISQITMQKEDIARQKQELIKQRNEVASVKNAIERRKKEISIQLASRSGILRKLNMQEQTYKSQIEDLSNESEQLTAIIKKLQEQAAQRKNAVRFAGGKLGWPVPGIYDITDPFGPRYHPILKVERMHTGIDIGTSYGSTVVASADGRVIYAGWFGGYGNAVVIDHGDGISTLYGHNSSLLVKEGDMVKRGQAIAKSGSTGLSTGPHLHFEVRKDGVPVNPMDWLK